MRGVENGVAYDTIVPIAHSSVDRGDGEGVVPSRMSELVFYASALLVREHGLSNVVLAGEQSYRGHPETTGELLVARHRSLLPPDTKIEFLPPGEDRLLNTWRQARALARYFGDNPDLRPIIVAFDFHRGRLASNLRHHGLESFEIVSADNELAKASYDPKFDHFLADIGFTASWVKIYEAIGQFGRRERLTRIGDSVRLVDRLTAWRDSGRFDDITSAGYPKMGTTDPPRWRRALQYHRKALEGGEQRALAD